MNSPQIFRSSLRDKFEAYLRKRDDSMKDPMVKRCRRLAGSLMLKVPSSSSQYRQYTL